MDLWSALRRLGNLDRRTDADAAKHRGLSYFILDMKSPGITVRPIRQLSGDAHFNQVFLDEVRIPAENVLGEVNDGWSITMTTLMNERMIVASGEISIDPAQVIELARTSMIGGRPATEDSSIQQSLVDLHIRNELLRFLRYRHLTALKRNPFRASRVPSARSRSPSCCAARVTWRFGCRVNTAP